MDPLESGQTTEQEMETGQSCGSEYRAQASQVQEMCSDLETTQGEQQTVIFQPHSALSGSFLIDLTRNLVIKKLYLQQLPAF